MEAELSVKRYDGGNDRARWNEFVTTARQASFLFNRAYMDYHADRFRDFSLMIFKGKRLFALLPASVDGTVITSHAGLTYGGLLTGRRATLGDISAAFEAITSYLREQGITQIIYKPTPYIYHTEPADEDLYVIWQQHRAKLVARQVSTTIDRDNPGRRFDIRRQGAKRAAMAGVTIAESTDFAPFWTILEQNLAARHNARPVHSLDEITLLASRFPDNIKLYIASAADGTALAGVVIYRCKSVIHSQYISASPQGREMGALDLLFDHIINQWLETDTARYFDFGTSTEQRGAYLNAGLLYQKEGFGGRATLYDFYSIDL